VDVFASVVVVVAAPALTAESEQYSLAVCAPAQHLFMNTSWWIMYVTTTGKSTAYTRLPNGHFNCLLDGRNRLRRYLSWPTGEQDVLDDLGDKPMLRFHGNLGTEIR